MSRIAALAISLLVLIAAGLATAAVAGAEDEGTTYQRYADIRERLYACHMEVIQGTQTSDRQKDCAKLARYYVLYASPGEGYTLHVHCRSASHCIGTPAGEPAANEAYPSGSTILDLTIPRAATHHKKKRRHRHHKARSRRSRAAHGSAVATR
jgi:hypothetical protein